MLHYRYVHYYRSVTSLQLHHLILKYRNRNMMNHKLDLYKHPHIQNYFVPNRKELLKMNPVEDY